MISEPESPSQPIHRFLTLGCRIRAGLPLQRPIINEGLHPDQSEPRVCIESVRAPCPSQALLRSVRRRESRAYSSVSLFSFSPLSRAGVSVSSFLAGLIGNFKMSPSSWSPLTLERLSSILRDTHTSSAPRTASRAHTPTRVSTELFAAKRRAIRRKRQPARSKMAQKTRARGSGGFGFAEQ